MVIVDLSSTISRRQSI